MNKEQELGLAASRKKFDIREEYFVRPFLPVPRAYRSPKFRPTASERCSGRGLGAQADRAAEGPTRVGRPAARAPQPGQAGQGVNPPGPSPRRRYCIASPSPVTYPIAIYCNVSGRPGLHACDRPPHLHITVPDPVPTFCPLERAQVKLRVHSTTTAHATDYQDRTSSAAYAQPNTILCSISALRSGGYRPAG